MAGTFGGRLQVLSDLVGEGTLTGRVAVDQVYALAQHSGFWRTGPNAGVMIRNHPQGGGSHFLSRPLEERHPRYLRSLAEAVLDGRLVTVMAQNMEDLSAEVYDRAPREFHDLRKSGHPTVESNGQVVYDRAPQRGRLDKPALREKAKRRRLGEGPSERLPDVEF